MTYQNRVNLTCNDGQIYVKQNDEIEKKTILVVDPLPHELDELKEYLIDETLNKFWNDASIIECIFNNIALDEDGAEIVSLDKIRDRLEEDLEDPPELVSKCLQSLEEIFDIQKTQISTDPVAQCIRETVSRLNTMGLLNKVYEAPSNLLKSLMGAKLSKVGRVISTLLYHNGQCFQVGNKHLVSRIVPPETPSYGRDLK